MDIGAFLDGSGRRSSGGLGGGGFDRAATAAEELAKTMRILAGLIGGAGAARVAAIAAPTYSAGAFAAATAGSDPRAMFAQVGGAAAGAVEQLRAAWGKLSGAVLGDGGRMSQAVNLMTAPLRAVGAVVGNVSGLWHTLGDNLVRVSALFYSFERVGQGLERAFVGPYRAIVAATEKAREFEAAISGVAGGAGRAREVDHALVLASRDRPQTVGELRDVGREMALIPSLSGRLALGGSKGAAGDVTQFADLVSALGTLDPGQGVRGALVAIREGASGDLTSLRRRLEISPDLVASLVGKTPRDLSGDPRLFLQGLQQYRKLYVPDAAIDARANQPSVLAAKLRENLDLALEAIGERGIFDKVAARMRSGFETIFDYVNKDPAFAARAQSISDSLGKIFDNIVDSLLRFTARLAGSDDVAKTPDAFVAAVDKALKNVSAQSGRLVGVADGIGGALNDIVNVIGSFLGDMKELSASAQKVQRGGIVGALAPESLPDRMREDLVYRRTAVDSELDRLGYGGLRGTGRLVPLSEAKPSGERNAFGERNEGSRLDAYADGRITGLRRLNSGFNSLLGQESDVKVYSYASREAESVITELENAVAAAGLGTDDNANFINRPRFDKLLTDRGFKARLDALVGGAGRAAPVTAAEPGPSRADRIYNTLPAELTNPKNGLANYRVKFAPVTQASAKLGESYTEEADGYEKVSRGASSQLDYILNRFKLNDKDVEEKPGDLIAKVRELHERTIGSFDKAIGELAELVAGDPLAGGPAAAKLKTVMDRRVELETAYQEDAGRASQFLAASVRRAELGIAGQLEGTGTTFRTRAIEQIVDGTNPLAMAAAKRLGLDQTRAFGLTSQPAFERPGLLDQLTRFRQAETDQAISVGGTVQAGDSLDAILGRARRGMAGGAGSLAFGRGGADLRVDLWRRQSEAANANYTELQKTEAPGSRALLAAGDQVARYAAQLREAQAASDRFFGGMVEWAGKVQEALENSLGKGLESLITGTGNLSDVFKGFARDVISSFSQMASKNLLRSIVGDPDGSKSGFGGLLGGLITGLTGALGGGTGAKAAGDGDVWPSFTPVAAFGVGGVATGPMVGIVGERHQPEGIVPLQGGMIPLGLDASGGVHAQLPGNRKIPAAFTSGAAMFAEGGVFAGGGGSGASFHGGAGGGGGDRELRIYNVASVDQAMAQGYNRAKGDILNHVLKEGRVGGKLRRVLDQKY